MFHVKHVQTSHRGIGLDAKVHLYIVRLMADESGTEILAYLDVENDRVLEQSPLENGQRPELERAVRAAVDAYRRGLPS
jgi:hypothetical protein